MKDISKTFEQEYCCEFIIDADYELYVSAWTAYHKAADRIDGHIKYPTNKMELELCSWAAKAGNQAKAETLGYNWFPKNEEDYEKYHSAKLEALRRLGK